MSVDHIDVVCDDPRHEGEFGEVETFVRLTPGGEWITAEQLAEKGPAQTGWRDHHKGATGEAVHSYRCGVCPRRPQQFQCKNSTLQWLLNTVAAQGMSQPTVRTLNVLLSQPTVKGL